MIYTTTPGGDEIVQKDMDKIMSASRRLKFKSLVLFGAFGKGEGLVWEGKPRNDYDLLLVGGNETNKKVLEGLRLGCKVEVWLVDKVKPLPTQQWYEIRYASKLLLGEPLNLPDWQPWDILFEDAIGSLNRRAVSLLVGKYEMGKDQPDVRKITEQIAKAVIALGDAILIKRGQFDPRYSVRNLLLSQDSISPIYQTMVSAKLTGYPDLNPDHQWEFWHQTRNMYRDYMVENQLGSMALDVLFNLTDRTTQEDLGLAIEKLGGKEWL